jgi:hypothetical protein
MNKIKTSTNLPFPKPSFPIYHDSGISMWGSCFAEHMKKYFHHSGFKVDSNPFGVIYNPISLLEVFKLIQEPTLHLPQYLTQKDGMWTSWLFHSSIHRNSEVEISRKVNLKLDALKQLYTDFKQTFIFSIGTSWVYEHHELNKVVANCHKAPQSNFHKKLLPINEMVKGLQDLLGIINTFNKDNRIILTISPVRHLNDGFIGNSRSKARLIEAIQTLIEQNSPEKVSYFPAYEIMMDELRGYRYYSSDLIHPNNLAVEIIWDKFTQTYFNSNTAEICRKVASYHQLKNHRILNSTDENIKNHQDQLSRKKEEILTNHPLVHF